jgi:large subunit ribosomal protein L15e
MGAYKYLNQIYKKKQSDVLRFLLRIRAWEYRHQKKIVRVTKPTRPERARRIGFKAKQGYAVFRVRIRRGGRKKQVSKGKVNGKPANEGINHLKPNRNLQVIAEGKVGRKAANMRVLHSYWVNQDSKYKWYEVICVDPSHEKIRMDARINWICKPKQKHREARGKTHAGRKHRGLGGKGLNYSKTRPSRRAVWRRHNTLKLARKR